LKIGKYSLHNLRKRTHDRELPDRHSHLADSNFIVCVLFYEAYFRTMLYVFVLFVHLLSQK